MNGRRRQARGGGAGGERSRLAKSAMNSTTDRRFAARAGTEVADVKDRTQQHPAQEKSGTASRAPSRLWAESAQCARSIGPACESCAAATGAGEASPLPPPNGRATAGPARTSARTSRSRTMRDRPDIAAKMPAKRALIKSWALTVHAAPSSNRRAGRRRLLCTAQSRFEPEWRQSTRRARPRNCRRPAAQRGNVELFQHRLVYMRTA